MKKYTQPLKPDTYYHIYNRGINGEDIFKEERNYAYFLEKLTQFLIPSIEVYSYCLLKNHFYILIRTKSEDELKGYIPQRDVALGCEKYLSKQFATFFKSYSLSINKSYKRTGGLFETPFRRIEVAHNSYFSELIRYIHFNPQEHGFVDKFEDYQFSSYNIIKSKEPSFLESKKVIEWFGGARPYVDFHSVPQQDNSVKGISFD